MAPCGLRLVSCSALAVSCPVLTHQQAQEAEAEALRQQVIPAIGLRARYAMSGTDTAYAGGATVGEGEAAGGDGAREGERAGAGATEGAGAAAAARAAAEREREGAGERAAGTG
eukprot:3730609-Rhodomonas_salina.3